MKHLIILFFLLFLTLVSYSQQQEVPYTLADRDRLIKVESNLEVLNKRVNKLDESINNRIDNVEQNLSKCIDRFEDKFDTYFTWGFGLVLGAIFTLFGFIIYDRRTTLAPVKREQDKILEALRELSKKDSNIREALKKAAL